MNVNIVYTGKGKDNVLHRMAQALADETGWEYTTRPTGTAEVTHFICYVEFGERFSDWHVTPVSAWLTHHEAHIPFKHFWWESSCNSLDLRLTAARLYLPELREYGPTALVARPPVDPQFTIAPRGTRPGRPVVGVSGIVHPGGRKGERLVARLAGSKLGARVDLVATGEGWPCQTTWLDWRNLPAWYNDLDVFLCTSTIEGVPMPPLEALACGVPVVVPRGVGLLDDLPDRPGVYRYDKNDFDGMSKALEAALGTEHDREALRAVVEPYSAANWAADHALAFSEMGHSDGLESDRHGQRGVVYVAYGAPARECTRAAIGSFREHVKGVEVALIGSEPGLGEDIFIECPDVDIGGRHAKTLIYSLAPRDWEYVMYLDGDTQVCADISFLFNVLSDGWDMVICKNPVKYHIGWQMARSDNHDECEATFAAVGTGEVVQLNGGVWAMQRNERTAAFFKAWHDEWAKWGKRDQGALLRALYANPVKLYVLENWPWNFITRYAAETGHEDMAGVCIKHYPMTARRWRGKVRERSDSAAAWEAVKQFEKSQGR